MSNVDFWCIGAEERPFASCTLAQTPTEANGYTAIIDFNDDAPGGPATYVATLSFDSNDGSARCCSNGDGTAGSGGSGGSSGQGAGGELQTGGAPHTGGGDSGGGGGVGPECGSHGVIEVRSLIDGRDRLVITQDTLHFEHLSWAGPGLESFRREPTEVLVTSNGMGEPTLWCPIWENGCNTCDGSCGELRVDEISSEPLIGRFLPGCVSNLQFSCSGAEGRFEASCALEEAPLGSSGRAVILFDDDAAGGPAYYQARLSFDYSETPECGCPRD